MYMDINFKNHSRIVRFESIDTGEPCVAYGELYIKVEPVYDEDGMELNAFDPEVGCIRHITPSQEVAKCNVKIDVDTAYDIDCEYV